jgi:hypothetical protein
MSGLCAQPTTLRDVKIVGLTGRAGVGKDTLGKVLTQHHGYVRFAFADAMRSALLDLNPVVSYQRLQDVIEERGWDRAKREFSEVRRLLQVFGTEVIRSRDEGFWISAVEREILCMAPIPTRIVVTDVRFDNEAQWVLGLSHRNEVIQVRRTIPELGGGHISESGIDPVLVTHFVDNDGSKNDLMRAGAEIASR